MKQFASSLRHNLRHHRYLNSLDFLICLGLASAYVWRQMALSSVLQLVFFWVVLPRAILSFWIYGMARWPRQTERFTWVAERAVLAALVLWIGFSVDWISVSQMRPDWRGAGSVLAMGAVGVLFFWPLLWLFDNVFKPFAVRSGHHILGALGFIAVCITWWGGLVITILTLSGENWH